MINKPNYRYRAMWITEEGPDYTEGTTHADSNKVAHAKVVNLIPEGATASRIIVRRIK